MGQKRMQSSPDIFLGWVTTPLGVQGYVRQLRDAKIKPLVETMDATACATLREPGRHQYEHGGRTLHDAQRAAGATTSRGRRVLGRRRVHVRSRPHVTPVDIAS
jgi:hypothetical protein